jgi:hypothetical protein
VVFFHLECFLEAGLVGTGNYEMNVTSPTGGSIQIDVQGNFKAADSDHGGAEPLQPPVQPLPDGVNVSLVEVADRQLPFRVCDRHKGQWTGVKTKQLVGFRDHLVPMVTAREPAAVQTSGASADIWFTPFPVRLLGTMFGVLQPASHLPLPVATLLPRLKVGQAQGGHQIKLLMFLAVRIPAAPGTASHYGLSSGPLIKPTLQT